MLVHLTEKYENFEAMTRKALKHAVAEAGYSLDDNAVEEVIKAYDQLTVYAHLNVPHANFPH